MSGARDWAWLMTEATGAESDRLRSAVAGLHDLGAKIRIDENAEGAQFMVIHGNSIRTSPRFLGSWVSKTLKRVGDFFEDAWKDVWNEARRVGNRVSDELKRTIEHVGDGGWWRDTVLTGLSRNVALRFIGKIAAFVYPPIALVAEGIQAFLAKYKAEFVASPEFAATVGKDETNDFLGEVVKNLNAIDIFQTLPTMALTELSIQAQDSRQRRDALRMEVIEIQARYANESWVTIARNAFQFVQDTVLTVVTWGAGSLIVGFIRLGQMAMSAAVSLLQMQMAREAMQISRDKVREQRASRVAAEQAEIERIKADIDRVKAEIAALGGNPAEVVAPESTIIPAPLTTQKKSDWSFTLFGIEFTLPPAPPPPLEDALGLTWGRV